MLRKPRRNRPEAILTTHYFRWLGYAYPRAFKVAHHIPNEGKRSVIEGALLKQQGLKKGTPDICIPIANESHHSLYLEVKIKPNKPTKEQKEMISLLEAEGNRCEVCYTLDELIGVTTDYMEKI